MVGVGCIDVLRGLCYESINPKLKPGAAPDNPDSASNLPGNWPRVTHPPKWVSPCGPRRGSKKYRDSIWFSVLPLRASVSPTVLGYHIPTTRKREIAIWVLLASQDPCEYQMRPPAWKTTHPSRCFMITPSWPCISPFSSSSELRGDLWFALDTCPIQGFSKPGPGTTCSRTTGEFSRRGFVKGVTGNNADPLNWNP